MLSDSSMSTVRSTLTHARLDVEHVRALLNPQLLIPAILILPLHYSNYSSYSNYSITPALLTLEACPTMENGANPAQSAVSLKRAKQMHGERHAPNPTYLLGPSPLSNRKRSHARLINCSEIGRSRLRDLRIRLTGRAEMLIWYFVRS